ncbi:MAG: hypothetical protein R3261_08470 [Alphaproteobacteria bacterium]|nr:hypothetical protein [Alphaproteobacteria bacterium]
MLDALKVGNKVLVAIAITVGIFFLFNIQSSYGQSASLTASEIHALLNGKVISGNWDGKTYKQIFYKNGHTSYFTGNRPENGKWRVNVESNRYESQWGGPSMPWSSYEIHKLDGMYFWIDRLGGRQPFSVSSEVE